MPRREFHSFTVPVPSISLDYGADETTGGEIAFSEYGIVFGSRWQFSIGAQLRIVLTWRHCRCGACKLAIEGTVVSCEPAAASTYETTLLFLDPEPEVRESLCEFAHRNDD